MLLEIVLFGFLILFFNLLLLVYINWNRQWQPTPVLLPGESHGQRSLVSLVHGVAESQTRLNDLTFTFHFHSLEKEMATHSSILAWRIPGKGEPGGLPSVGLHRVGHDWSDIAAAAADIFESNYISLKLYFMILLFSKITFSS